MKHPSNAPKRGGYVTICEWMPKVTGLHKGQLIVYAVIHSFSQDGQSCFEGGLHYLMYYSGFSKSQIQVVLKDLVEKKLIEKQYIKVDGTSWNDFKDDPKTTKHYVKYWTTFSRKNIEEQEQLLCSFKIRNRKK